MIKVAKCKIAVTAEDALALHSTMKVFAEAATEARSYAVEHKIRHKFALHAAIYHPLRAKYGLSANYVVRACDRAVDARKGVEFRPTSLAVDVGLCRYIPATESISVSTMAGRRHMKLSIGGYQRQMLEGVKRVVGSVNYDRHSSQFFVNIRVKFQDKPAGGSKPLGVDLGIKRIATLSTGEMFSGRNQNRRRERYARTQASMRRKGTKGCKRALKRLAGRDARFQKDVNHQISKAIVARAAANDCFIAMEELKGIRKRSSNKGRRFRRMIGRWSFYTLKAFIAYKAAAAGVRLVSVSPAYTSKTCPACSEIGLRKKHKFTCVSCGFIGDADIVGAINIAAQGMVATLSRSRLILER